MNTKWKIILAVIAINLVFSACFTAVFIFHVKNDLDEFVTLNAEGVSGIISTVEEQTSRQYQRRIKSFLDYNGHHQKEMMIKAFKERDKKELIRLTTPYFELFQKENPNFATLTWLLPNNTSYLHMHDTSKPGKDVSKHRPDIVSANKKRQQYAGFATSTVGMQYRIVNPVTFEGHHIGVVHFGLKMDLFIEAIQNKLHLPVGVVISNKKYERIINKELYIAGPSFAIQSSHIELFKKNFASIDWTLEKQQVVLHDKDYIILKAISLDNYVQESQGYVFVALDISKVVAEARSDILFILILCAALLSLSFLVLYFGYDSLSKKLESLQIVEKVNSELEVRVTERTHELRQSESKFRALVEDLSDWVWEVDAKGVYVYVSPRIHEILGFTPDEVIGKTPFDLMEQIEAERMIRIFGEYLEKQSSFKGIVNTNLHKDGSEVILESSGQPVFDEDGILTGYRGVDRDITEKQESIRQHKLLEEQLYEAQKMESIGRLAGGVAHDFNNILTAINGYAEICLMELDDGAPCRKEIQIISDAGQRATRLTQQLLAFSRRQIIRQEYIDLNKELDDVAKMLGRLIGEDVEIAFFKDEKLWKVKADRSQIEQVVLNLAINAGDAMPTGGKLTIETVNVTLDAEYIKTHYNIEPGDFVMLSISDTGYGMSRELKKHIFEPFFTTKETGKGTGLGLATVYGIIKQNNGEIIVYSEPGKGSTFKIYLPRAEEIPEEETTQLSKGEKESISKGTETIMLVEDDEMVRKMSVDILAGLGYTVLEAVNGEDAMQVSSRFHGNIDLLLTDVVMPKMSGVELAENMKQHCPDTKVLFMSGYTENAIVKHGVLADDVNFIHKPLTPKSLSKAVRKVLD